VKLSQIAAAKARVALARPGDSPLPEHILAAAKLPLKLASQVVPEAPRPPDQAQLLKRVRDMTKGLVATRTKSASLVETMASAPTGLRTGRVTHVDRAAGYALITPDDGSSDVYAPFSAVIDQERIKVDFISVNEVLDALGAESKTD